jgi:hypothetical protein
MHVWLLLCALAGLTSAETCRAGPAAQADAQARMEKLLFVSEDVSRPIHQDDVPHFWINGIPPGTTYQRIHGGIEP